MQILKYILIAIAIFLVGYLSIEIKPLDEVKKGEQSFDATAYARNYLTQTLPPAFEKAISVSELVSLLATDKDKAFEDYSQAVSIGNIRHFLVKGEGFVAQMNEDDVILKVGDDTKSLTIKLATEFIYGSSIRDAAGLFDIREFTNNTDMNNVAAEINKIIREEVIPPFKVKINTGDKIQFIGALEMNQSHPKFDNLEVLPLRIK